MGKYTVLLADCLFRHRNKGSNPEEKVIPKNMKNFGRVLIDILKSSG
jgi:hypothetical protein